MMAYYVVRTEVIAVIEAETPEEARIANLRDWHDISTDTVWRGGPPVEIHSLAELPESWDEWCLPYNGDGKARLNELLPEH